MAKPDLDITILDVDDSAFQTLLSGLPKSDTPVTWTEDEMFPYTDEDRLRDTRWCYLFDRYGREVANLWLKEGCPEKFSWTEIIRTGDGDTSA